MRTARQCSASSCSTTLETSPWSTTQAPLRRGCGRGIPRQRRQDPQSGRAHDRAALGSEVALRAETVGNNPLSLSVKLDMPCACALVAFATGFTFAAGPATIRFESEYWDAPSWDSPWAWHRSFHCEAAGSKDGSRYVRCEARSFRFRVVPAGEGSFGSIYLASEHAGFDLDHKKHIATGGPCSCTWYPNDRVGYCRLLEHHARTAKLLGQDLIAGFTVRRFSTQWENWHTQTAFAPGLDCEILEWNSAWRGITGIPWSGSSWRVTSYEPGEPPRERFRIPNGYTVIPRRM
jgi:hypothetical protein